MSKDNELRDVNTYHLNEPPSLVIQNRTLFDGGIYDLKLIILSLKQTDIVNCGDLVFDTRVSVP